MCRRRVSGLFHPPCGALFTFPSRYLCTIGHREYLALEGGPPSFPANSTCWLVLRCRSRAQTLSATGLSPTVAGRPRRVRLGPALVTLWDYALPLRSYNPGHAKPGRAARMIRFRLIPVRSPLLREYFPFLGVMRCFSSPGGLHLVYVFNQGSSGMTRTGLPHSEIPGYGRSHLTGAYRSVATSFIGSRRPGIHPAPFLVCAVVRLAAVGGPALGPGT